ncbi:MAG: aspartate aminotransferase family protein [Rickettsiaceae bacterium H1]|nr:aspartate aminotransferase family protein [Rickettsiaceae bacterium H1]
MSPYLLNVYNRSPVNMVRGEGSYLYDDQGKKYLDFTAGIATVALGHSHPYLIQAIGEQSEKLWHCSNLFNIPEQEKLARRLVNLTFADRVFFCSSGLEATEAAIKFIRRYCYVLGQHNKRKKIITVQGGFHGRSITAISAGGNDYAKEGYGPLLDGFVKIPRNDIDAFENVIDENVGGVFLELIQSEGGIYPLDIDYLQKIRKITHDQGILLAFDEVQTGYGRTGSLFYHQALNFEPDLLTCAKAMGNGFPIAGCLVKQKIADAMKPGSHGSTYGGNPMAMAVGNAVLDVMTQPDFFTKISEIIIYLHQSLDNLQNQFSDLIKEIRKVGFLIGIEFHSKINTRLLIEKCLTSGLIIGKTAQLNTIRLAPPIIITKEQIDKFSELLISVICKK